MTGTEVIARVRPLISDEDEVRYADAALMLLVVAARRELYRRQPEAFFVSSIVITAPADVTDVAADLGVRDSYLDAVVHFVSYLVFLEDSEDTANANLAHVHFEHWEDALA